MMHCKRLAALLAALSLAACTQQAVKPAAESASPGTAPAVAATEDGREASRQLAHDLFIEDPPPPNVELTDELLFQFLVAEVAGQRGNLPLATQTYLEMAKSTRDPRVVQRATEIALFARQPRIALEGAELWIELNPDSFRAHQIAATLLVSNKQGKEAKQHLEKLIAVAGEHVDHAFMQVNGILARYPDRQEALAMMRDLAKNYQTVPEARLAVAQIAYSAGENQDALEETGAALKLRPDWEMAAVFRAQVLMRMQGEDAAAVSLQDYLRTYPKAKDARLNLARMLAAGKRYAESRSEFQKLLEEFPDNADVVYAIGLLSQRLRDYDMAETQFKRLLDMGYRDPDQVRIYMGQLNEARKQYDRAVEWYGSVAPGSEDYWAAQTRIAIALGRQGKVQEGRDSLHRLTPQNNQQRVQLIQAEAQVLREHGEYKAVFDFLGGALEKLPNHPELMYDYAMAAEKIDRLDLLEATLRKLIQLQPDNAHAYNGLGYTLADRTQRYQEALELIQKALELSPDDFAIIDSMGWVQYRMGNVKQSLEYLRRAYDDTQDPEVAAHLGEVLWTQGERREAEKIWRDTLKDNPDNPVLFDVIKKFLP